MKLLWAPWRKIYIEQERSEGCIFCDKAKARNDKKNYIVSRAATCFSLLNLFPYNGGHLMIAPFRHVADLNGLEDRELTGLIALVRDSISLLKRVLKPEGFNVGMNLGLVAGAGVVDHVHIHLVPRWSGDTNFMPIIADTKVVPQSLDAMYKMLTAKTV